MLGAPRGAVEAGFMAGAAGMGFVERLRGVSRAGWAGRPG